MGFFRQEYWSGVPLPSPVPVRRQLLGFQVLFLLVELVPHGPCFLGSSLQRLVLLVLTDFPEVPFLSLVNDSEHTGDGSANNSDLGKFGSPRQLGQRYLRILQLFQQLIFAAKASSVLLPPPPSQREKAFSVPLGRGFPPLRVPPFSSPSLTCRITTSPECLSRGLLLSSFLASGCLLLSLHPDVKHFPSPFSKRKLMAFSSL